MKIIKEADIKISSRIENVTEPGTTGGDIERSEVKAIGFYHYVSGGKVLITYSEQIEGEEINTEVECFDKEVRVKRSGSVESDFCFVEGITHRSLYTVNPYKFDAEIMPKRVRVQLGCEGGEIDLFYSMRIGGADKNVRMKIEIAVKDGVLV